MASVLLPPSSNHFNSLPDIMESHDVVEACMKGIFPQICDIFIRHGVQQTFGITLVHQHFNLEQNEKLVNIGNVAIPLQDGLVPFPTVATRWAFTGDKVIPYEFTKGAERIELDQYPDFVGALGEFLHSYGLSKHIGLYALGNTTERDSGMTTEFTSGRINVTLPFDNDPNSGSVVEAAWQVREGTINLNAS
ncbi:MAG: hypothetical protein M1820_010547 [Bogoriella megaspora]|nr:MAG: hypothetical protein M1820_010547 [Bogoriella megaspora]